MAVQELPPLWEWTARASWRKSQWETERERSQLEDEQRRIPRKVAQKACWQRAAWLKGKWRWQDGLEQLCRPSRSTLQWSRHLPFVPGEVQRQPAT